MANIYVPKFLKRTASQASFDSPVPPKKPAQDVPLEAPTTVLTPQQAPASSPSRRQFSVVHLPKLKWDLQRSLRLHDSAIDERAIQNMLMKSIQIALQAVGFESAESEALESFRVDVEECMYTRTTQELDMAHFLATVRDSMLGCRRIHTIPQDFLQALHMNQLSLRALTPHLEPPVPPSQSQYKIVRENARNTEEERVRLLASFSERNAAGERGTSFPKRFPRLPSTHTYKATPEFPDREHDPRKIRERATEEGRLGEEALRKLVGAASGSGAKSLEAGDRSKSIREQRNDMWQDTMKTVGQSTASLRLATSNPSEIDRSGQHPANGKIQGGNYLGTAVNAEKRYWRKPKK